MDESARRRESDERHRRLEIWRIAYQELNLTFCDMGGNTGICDRALAHYRELGVTFSPQFLWVVRDILSAREDSLAACEAESAHQMSVMPG